MASIKQYIAEGEHVQQDFKTRIDDQRKIARTLAAFANTEGGRLLIGVKDNGKIKGIVPEEEFHMIQGAAELFCRPAVQFTSNIWQEDAKLVLEIKVASVAKKFIKATDEDGSWKCFIRVKDETLKANKIILKLWKLDQRPVEKPLTFRQQELVCLKAISKEDNPVNISRLYKAVTELSKQQIDDSLALLLHWKMVEWLHEDGKFVYRIPEAIEII